MWKRAAAGAATVVGLTALWRWVDRERPMFISKERANRAWKDAQMDDPEEHAYKLRVKDRIMKGMACTHPPLFVGKAKPRLNIVRNDVEAKTA